MPSSLAEHWDARALPLAFALMFGAWTTIAFERFGEQPTVDAITTFTMGQLAKLIERFKRVSIGAGTLLDHAGIMAYSEVGEGKSHSLDDIPILTIGRAGGAVEHSGPGSTTARPRARARQRST